MPMLAREAQTKGLDLNIPADQQKFADWTLSWNEIKATPSAWPFCSRCTSA